MNRDQPYRRSNRDRFESDDSRQFEQFANSDEDSGEDYRSYRQMGDSGSRGDYGQSDPERYGANRGGWAGDRNRGGYDRQREDRQRSAYSEQGGGYSSGGYGQSSYGNNEGRGFGSFTSSDFGGRDFAGPRQGYGSGRTQSDPYGGYGSGSSAASSYGAGSQGRSSYSGGGSYGSSSRGSSNWDQRSDDRGFFERAGDEVASWFGDEDAARRREQDHRGRGPANYTRSDERILEDACDRLTQDWGVDASNIQVTVQAGEVTLDGTVTDRRQKRRAEDVVDDLSGVKHVQNNLRIQQSRNSAGSTGRSDTTSGTLA
jgi:osmotically-inducible protein OsmY